MPTTDIPLEHLRRYTTSVTPPQDLWAFWDEQLGAARSLRRPATFTRVDTGLSLVDTFDVTFSGHGLAPIKAWLHLPRVRRQGDDGFGGEYRAQPRPTIVNFIGYGGGRGLSHEVPPTVLAGYAHLEVDTRGQGSVWRTGDTPDPAGSAPATPGYLTRGILDPRQAYYTRLFTDAVLATEMAAGLDVCDGTVVTAGRSQGGGLAAAAAALAVVGPGGAPVAGALVDVPFLADMPRGVDLADQGPYRELETYLAAHPDHVSPALRTLSYLDVTVLAPRATCPVLISVGHRDQVCPPSTAYALANAWGTAHPQSRPEVQVAEYLYNDHDGGGQHHVARQLRWLEAITGDVATRKPPASSPAVGASPSDAATPNAAASTAVPPSPAAPTAEPHPEGRHA